MHCLWVSMPQFFCLSPLPQWIVKVDRVPILKRIPWSCNWKGQGGFGINQPIPFGEIPSLHNKYPTIFIRDFQLAMMILWFLVVSHYIPMFISIFPLYLYCNPTKIEKWTSKVGKWVMSVQLFYLGVAGTSRWIFFHHFPNRHRSTRLRPIWKISPVRKELRPKPLGTKAMADFLAKQTMEFYGVSTIPRLSG